MKGTSIKLKAGIQLVENFCKFSNGNHFVEYEISKAWHFNNSKGVGVPFGLESGVYIYSKTNPSNWDIPADQSNEEILYIGKSDGDIGGRVWAHMGLIYEPGTDYEVCDPRFKYNQWAKDLSVPDDVKRDLAAGNITVTTISLKSNKGSFYPEALEKYILSLIVRNDGKPPILNKAL